MSLYTGERIAALVIALRVSVKGISMECNHSLSQSLAEVSDHGADKFAQVNREVGY